MSATGISGIFKTAGMHAVKTKESVQSVITQLFLKIFSINNNAALPKSLTPASISAIPPSGSNTVSAAGRTQITADSARVISKPLYDGIAFSGGGAKGFAYAGVIQELGDRLDAVKEVSGASAGAMTAMLVSLGLKSEQIVKEFSDQKTAFKQEVLANSLQETIERALLPHKDQIVAILREYDTALKTAENAQKTAEYAKIDQEVQEKIDHMINHTGTEDIQKIHDIKNYGKKLKNDADAIRDKKYASGDWLKNITLKQLDIIREQRPELGIKKLYLTASLYEKKNNMTSEVLLSAETTPNMPLYQAALASSALPGLLPTVNIKNKDFFAGAIYGTDNPDKIIRLRDGGVHNNLPHQYLTGEKKLILNFSDNQGIHLRKLTLFENIKNIITGEPVYKRRQSDTSISEEFNRYNHYVDPRTTPSGEKVRRSNKVSTTDLKKAKQHFPQITKNAAEDFARFEANQSQQPDKQSASQGEIQRETNKRRYSK